MDSENTGQVKHVKTTTRIGFARTKHGEGFIIDANAVVLDSTKVVPKECLGKYVLTQMFKFEELDQDDVIKYRIDRITSIEIEFKSFCMNNNIKYKSKTYYKYQMVYFNGAIAALGEVPVKWGVCLMSSREIIEDYTKK